MTPSSPTPCSTSIAMSRRSYGSPRVHAELVLGQGQRCSRKRVARLMAQAGIVGIHRRKFRGCTRRDPDATPAEDLVKRNFNPTEPDRLWVMDVTEHPTGGGQGLSGRRPRRLEPAGGGLVDRRSHPIRARRRCRADGRLATTTTSGRDGGPFRPRISIHILGLRSPTSGRRTARFHGHHRGLLRQQRHGELLRDHADRAARRAPLGHPQAAWLSPCSTGSRPGTTRRGGTPIARCSARSTTNEPTRPPQLRHDQHNQPVRWSGGSSLSHKVASLHRRHRAPHQRRRAAPDDRLPPPFRKR